MKTKIILGIVVLFLLGALLWSHYTIRKLNTRLTAVETKLAIDEKNITDIAGVISYFKSPFPNETRISGFEAEVLNAINHIQQLQGSPAPSPR